MAKGTEPALVAQIDGIDASGDGGLLGIALSPSYDEDGLIYAYVTTADGQPHHPDRPRRRAEGDLHRHPQGRHAQRRPDRLRRRPHLYVGTGDTGNPTLAADPTSLAGKVLRLDEFGKPAESNPAPGSPIYASGFSQVTGMCPLDGGGMAALDQRKAEDVLLPLTAGKDYGTVDAGEAMWTWTAADGGAANCSITSGLLVSTSLDKQQLTGIQMAAGGSFTGSPSVMLDNRYGRLLTVVGDQTGLLWLTTSNKDGLGTPVPSDDRVVVVPSGSSGRRRRAGLSLSQLVWSGQVSRRTLG